MDKFTKFCNFGIDIEKKIVGPGIIFPSLNYPFETAQAL
jgi:hypothetical protein